jgi:hypothetical protein
MHKFHHINFGIKKSYVFYVFYFLAILLGGLYIMPTSPTQAVRATDFNNSIGINTHIDFTWTAYGNTQLVINSLNYLGVDYVRDSANNPADIGPNGLWQQVANGAGVKFDAFIGSGSPATMQTGLQYIQQLAPQNLLISIEGGNEEDGAYAAANGNTLAITAQFQQQVYSVGHALGLPVINMSFGAGWETPNGNYDAVGDISPYSDYANAHTYFGTGQSPNYNINWVNSLAQMSSHHSVITTEMGWYTTGSTTDATSVSEAVQAKYMLDGLMDAYKAGDARTYLYELLDQHTGDGYSENNFGLFHSDGTPKAAATALHNLTTLLADTGTNNSSFTPGALNYSLTGLQSTDNSLLMEKSDGSYWLSIWNETRLWGPVTPTPVVVPNHTVTLTLDNQASSITIYDPLTGTTAVQSVSNAQSVQISVPDHPVIVKIVPSGTQPPPDSHDLQVTSPTSLSATANGDMRVGGVSITDPWAASHSGTMALNVTVTSGTVSMTDASGRAVAGSGTNGIHISGTLAELNAELATLGYHGASTPGRQTLTVDVWNQGGVEVTNLTSIDVSAGSTGMSIATPASISLARNSAVQVSGVSINDAWAASHPGNLALNVTVNNGSLTMLDGSGHTVVGSGTNALHLSGTLAQLNAELATLSYQASNTIGTGSISVNAWNQAGTSVTQNIAVNSMLAGNVVGTTGSDILSASMGRSVTGASAADTFYFTPGTTGRGVTADHITDFSQAAGDKIDLHGFGLSAANFSSNGNFVGSRSFTVATVNNEHPYTRIMIDTNGDHSMDHEIRIDNGALNLHASDFMFA